MRQLIGIGTPRGLQGRLAAVPATFFVLISVARSRFTATLASHRIFEVIRGRPSSPTALVVNSAAMATYTTGC